MQIRGFFPVLAAVQVVGEERSRVEMASAGLSGASSDGGAGGGIESSSGGASAGGIAGGGAGAGSGARPLPLPSLLSLAPDFAAAFPGSPDASAIKEAIIAEFLRDRYACSTDDLDTVVGSVVRTSSAVQSVYVELPLGLGTPM